MCHKLYWMESTDSTNLDAVRGKDANSDKTVWFAEYQTAGKGQRGNKWSSHRAENLTFSILLKPTQIAAAGQYAISMVCAVGVVDYLGKLGLQAKIKWPNDIYIGDRKICGMLIENFLDGDRLSVSICGIGLNVNQKEFPDNIPNPTSVVRELGGEGLDIRKELHSLLDCIFKLYDNLCNDMEGTTQMLWNFFEEHLYRKDIWCEFEQTEYFEGGEPMRFEGCIRGIDRKSARIVIEKRDGHRELYYFKEIRYIIL